MNTHVSLFLLVQKFCPEWWNVSFPHINIFNVTTPICRVHFTYTCCITGKKAEIRPHYGLLLSHILKKTNKKQKNISIPVLQTVHLIKKFRESF